MANRKICNTLVDANFDERLFRRAVIECEQMILQANVIAFVEDGKAWAEIERVPDVSDETNWAIGCIARNIINRRYEAMQHEKKIQSRAPQVAAVDA